MRKIALYKPCRLYYNVIKVYNITAVGCASGGNYEKENSHNDNYGNNRPVADRHLCICRRIRQIGRAHV